MKSQRPFTAWVVLVLAFCSCKEDETVSPCIGGVRTASVSIAAGSSSPGCEQTSRCYLPFRAVVARGGQVTWSNDDSAVHSVTSGAPPGGGDGTFDSGLMSPGQTFSTTIADTGIIKYFCVVHPWMRGEIRVEGEICP